MANINNEIFLDMLVSAANNLCNHRQEVDNMNVFPVPDGDTGSNMSMTISACVKNIDDLRGRSLEDISKLIATSALRGARGNSGVILSQLIRGLQKSLVGVDEADCAVVASVFESAAESAYRAVMKPTEGTILTVARLMGEYAASHREKFDDVTEFLRAIVKTGNKALAITPRLLPQLKQAGVVDSGGQGLMYLLEGAFFCLENGTVISADEGSAMQSVSEGAQSDDVDIKFCYCTECIIDKKSADVGTVAFKAAVEVMGDSMVLVDDDEVVKIHIHTNTPDAVLHEALKIGSLATVKIENMRNQHSNLIKEKESAASVQSASEAEKIPEPAKKFAFAAVAVGQGIADTLRQLGVDRIIEGGQTMNPSTDDILTAINAMNADNIFVFPNNKNIIMAAQQAKDICDKNVIVIPTKSVTQAISCMLVFDESQSADDIESSMNDVMNSVVSAQITHAVRDTVVDGLEIKDGDILGMVDGKIKFVDKSVHDSAVNIVKSAINDDTSLVTLFYGADTPEDDADALCDELENMYPEVDFSMNFGGQPVYNYYISLE